MIVSHQIAMVQVFNYDNIEIRGVKLAKSRACEWLLWFTKYYSFTETDSDGNYGSIVQREVPKFQEFVPIPEIGRGNGSMIFPKW